MLKIFSSAMHNRNRPTPIDTPIPSTNVDHQRDSSAMNFDLIKHFCIENLLDKWKLLARELDVNENEIERISRENRSLKDKFAEVSFGKRNETNSHRSSQILDTIAANRQHNSRQILVDLLQSLKQCRRMSHYCKVVYFLPSFHRESSRSFL